ncbi:MAG: GNAT family N-acetyltransferase [Chitinophagaceae bacterium]|nr:GNAT family N-acetyltransferase [Chitinophagaceae bacterium]
MNLHWALKTFEELSNVELYKILQLRSSVFVVEQNCAFQDMDDNDQGSWHLCAWHNNELVAYTRLLPPGASYTEASIGRVVNSKSARGKSIGKELMQRSIEGIYTLFGRTAIKIGAQLYLKKFYESFGFKQVSDIYLEDDIEHIKMLLA